MPVTDLLRRDEADALVREAHRRTHRYPADFPGLRARVTLVDAAGPRHGAAILRPGAVPEIELTADQDALLWLERELGSLTEHRWHLPYEESDGRFDKDVDEEHAGALGRVVSMADPMLSSYWISDGLITRVSRSVGEDRLTIVLQAHAAAPDGRSVATQFAVVHQREDGSINATEAYSDAYEERWGLLVPVRRQVVIMTARGSAARELRLSDHERLDGAPR